jgi:hypothetical protein
MARVDPTSAVNAVPPVSAAAAALRVQALVQAEAGLMTTIETSPAQPDAKAPTPPAKPLEAAIANAAGRQGGLAPLMADLEQALASPALPAPVKAAMAEVLSLRTPLTATPTAGEIRNAMSTSGVFLEPRLAAGTPAQPDLKAALLVLRQALRSALPAATPQAADALPHPPTEPAPPPPFKGDIPHGQRPVAPSLSPGLSEHAALQHLEKATSGAIARTELLQFASLPDAPRDLIGADRPPPSWMFEVPFLTAQGAAIAQFKIERDGGGGVEGASDGPIWRTQFSIDLEPLGPIHAQVALGAGHTAVTLWAEREATASRLRQDQGELAGALHGADVTVYPGSPRAAPPAAGQFVDRST